MSEHNLRLLDPQKGAWDEEAISRRYFLTEAPMIPALKEHTTALIT
jgi:hypothetical protein